MPGQWKHFNYGPPSGSSGGSSGPAVTPVTSFPFTAPSASNQTVYPIYNTTGSPVTVELPASPGANQVITWVDAENNAGSHAITVDGNGNTISAYGSSSLTTAVINSNGGSLTFSWDGTQWTQYA